MNEYEPTREQNMWDLCSFNLFNKPRSIKLFEIISIGGERLYLLCTGRDVTVDEFTDFDCGHFGCFQETGFDY